LGFLKKLLILAVIGAVGAGAVALIEHLMFEAPKPAVSDGPPSMLPKKPAQHRRWLLI
jgi:hypothetical protein